MAVYLLLARHGSVKRQANVPEREQPLNCAGEQSVSEVAQIIQATMESDRIRLKEIRYSGYRHAQQTAEIIASAFESAGARPLTNRFLALEPPAFWTQDRQQALRQLLDQLRTDLIGLASGSTEANALMLVGHQPQLDWIGCTLLPRRNLPVGRQEVACLELDIRDGRPRATGRVLWMVSPTDDNAMGELREKVKGKMDTAKTLGGVLIFVLGFAMSVLVDSDKVAYLKDPGTASLTCVFGCLADRFGLIPPAGLYLKIFQASLGLLFVALGLYLACMYAYDRLLMPSRFWTESPGTRTPRWLVRRPPSSSMWVIYLNMMRTWRFTFTPATIAVVSGLAGIAAAVLRIDPVDLLVLLPLTATASLVYLRIARPRLGSED